MTIKITELVTFNEAAEALKLTTKDLLTKALDNEIILYTLVKKDRKIAFVLYGNEQSIDGFGELPLFSNGEIVSEELHLNVGQVLEITQKTITSLFVNGNFLENDFFNELFLNEHKNEVENSIWCTEELDDIHISIEDVFLHNSVLSQLASHKADIENIGIKSTKESASNTALKVIGLLLYHLAKNSKYASGENPNKSQVKELLISLADELNIDPYGLAKVDERLLSEALKYLESQKN
ncbi:MAG: hypothetical protein PF440_07075 [Thiomicrorhabdus sp.]|jgi:hypothetical protein|nr:hypothetical protein [Thiomicrorhabdus sp.]